MQSGYRFGQGRGTSTEVTLSVLTVLLLYYAIQYTRHDIHDDAGTKEKRRRISDIGIGNVESGERTANKRIANSK